MKNKKGNIAVITIIILIVAITAGVFGWMLAKKTLTPSTVVAPSPTKPAPDSQTKPNQISQNSVNSNPQKGFTIDGKKVRGYEIEVYFEEGIIHHSDKLIVFNPKNKIIIPEGQSYVGPSDDYDFMVSDYRTADAIIKEANQSPMNTKKAVQKEINGFTVVEYADGGVCDGKVAEVKGKTYNYKFSSLGCYHDAETDFAAFEKAIGTMKFIN
jgi:hypothetical protein